MNETKFIKIGLAGLASVALVAAYFVLRPPQSAPPRELRVSMTPEVIARGKFIYNVAGDCDSCHGERDFSKFGGPVLLSGSGFLFPPELGLPGKVVASNITMDEETGIGAWTDGEKLRAIREGIGRDGRALFPMMPYESFRHMSDADAEALVAYLTPYPLSAPPFGRIPRNHRRLYRVPFAGRSRRASGRKAVLRWPGLCDRSAQSCFLQHHPAPGNRPRSLDRSCLREALSRLPRIRNTPPTPPAKTNLK